MMRRKNQYTVEQWFDGERVDEEAVKKAMESDAAAADHAAFLKTLRAGISTLKTEAEISDAQLPAFMSGIREGIRPPARSHGGWWALVSLASAALIAAVSTLIVISGGATKVRAQSTVEEFSTDLKGGHASSFTTPSGATTVWVEAPEEDMW